MNKSAKRTIDGLERAMQAEMQGYHFYQMAAKSTDDPKAAETFRYLAEEERGHFDFLKGQEVYKYHLGGHELPICKCSITFLA